jgi:hypothetical protein
MVMVAEDREKGGGREEGEGESGEGEGKSGEGERRRGRETDEVTSLG